MSNKYLYFLNKESRINIIENIIFNLPKDLIKLFSITAHEIGIEHISIVGGFVRDQICKLYSEETITSHKDIDLIVEGSAYLFAKKIEEILEKERVSIIRINKSYSTVEMRIDDLLIDIATARIENYPFPAGNPNIYISKIENDLKRRDFTINAIALDLLKKTLLDPYKGSHAIKKRQLTLMHPKSIEDDPTRIIRGARYASRLKFHITDDSLKQITTTLKKWPWNWIQGEAEKNAPPGLSTRLRMELELLLEYEPWEEAIQYLQDWGALVLLDKTLQEDNYWKDRLIWAFKLHIHPLTALIAGSIHSISIAKRLQLPKKEQSHLSESLEIQKFFSEIYIKKIYLTWPPSYWCKSIEKHKWHPKSIAIAICTRHPLWYPLFQWLNNWKNIKSPISAKELISQGWIPGPLLKAELNRIRNLELDQYH